jgi:hypothetical protein
MNFNEKIKEMKIKMFELISTKEITLLKSLDLRIKFNKYGKYYYYKIYENNNNSKFWYFLSELEDNSVYMLIPIYSTNDKTDEPYITLSPQILITNKSNSLLLYNYINSKIIDTINLYNINGLKGILIFKYKKVTIDFKENNSF